MTDPAGRSAVIYVTMGCVPALTVADASASDTLGPPDVAA
jgi:hypothetical protein